MGVVGETSSEENHLFEVIYDYLHHQKKHKKNKKDKIYIVSFNIIKMH